MATSEIQDLMALTNYGSLEHFLEVSGFESYDDYFYQKGVVEWALKNAKKKISAWEAKNGRPMDKRMRSETISAELLSKQPGVLVDNISLLTEEMWLGMRKFGIGGSDCPKIMGVSSHGTSYDVWLDKTTGKPEDEDSWLRFRIGHLLEETVIEIFRRNNPGWTVKYERKMFFHRKHPWMIADCDAIAVSPWGTKWVLEVKTTSEAGLARWGKKLENQIPLDYQYQGRHYLAVLNSQYERPEFQGVIYICLAGNTEDGYRQRYLDRDNKIEEQICRKESVFWNNYVLKNVRPPLENDEEAAKVIKMMASTYKQRPETLVIPDDFYQNIEDMAILDTELENATARVKELQGKRNAALVPIYDYLRGADGEMSTPIGMYKFHNGAKESTKIPVSAIPGLLMEFPEAKKYVDTHMGDTSYKIKKTAV